ncbi:thioredoxin [Candidatus Poribacteria bacterium]|nr:thioredoxin [Candidatus Poribacteria bacterium]
MNKLKNYFWLMALAAALALGAYGVYRGEAIDVFEKARTICLECVGIG